VWLVCSILGGGSSPWGSVSLSLLAHLKITRLMFSTFVKCPSSCFVGLFSISYTLCFCIVLCIISPFLYICLFPIFVQVYRPLPQGENPMAVNKCLITSPVRRVRLFLPKLRKPLSNNKGVT